MAVYLGYTIDYDDRALVGHGHSLRRARAAVEAAISVYKAEATPEISVEEQIARRKRNEARIAAGGMVTSTSDMRPLESLRPIAARARQVHANDSGFVMRVRPFSLTMSVATLVDDGDWNYHYEWSDWNEVS